MTDINLDQIREEAEGQFGGHAGFFCSEAIASTLGKHFEIEDTNTLVRAATGFGVGIGGSRCSCGALTGGILTLSYLFGRDTAGDSKSEHCFALCNELHAKFVGKHKVACCKILTRKVMDDDQKHFLQCKGITGDIAYETAKIIQRELAK